VLIPGANLPPGNSSMFTKHGTGRSLVEKFPRDKTHLYGIFAGEPRRNLRSANDWLPFATWSKNQKTKKRPATSPSPALRSAIAIFDCLERTKPAPAVKSSLPTHALSRKSKGYGLTFMKEFPIDAGDKPAS